MRDPARRALYTVVLYSVYPVSLVLVKAIIEAFVASVEHNTLVVYRGLVPRLQLSSFSSSTLRGVYRRELLQQRKREKYQTVPCSSQTENSYVLRYYWVGLRVGRHAKRGLGISFKPTSCLWVQRVFL